MGIIHTENGYPVRHDNPLPVVLEGPVYSKHASADNDVASVSLPAPPPGQAHYVWGIVAGYTGAATGVVTIQDDGDTVEELPVNGALVDNRTRPLKVVGPLTISLSASGTDGTVGHLVVRYETR